MLQQHVRARGLTLEAQHFRCRSATHFLRRLSPLFHSSQMKGGEVSEDMLDAVGDMQLVESVALLSGGPHNDFVCVLPQSLLRNRCADTVASLCVVMQACEPVCG